MKNKGSLPHQVFLCCDRTAPDRGSIVLHAIKVDLPPRNKGANSNPNTIGAFDHTPRCGHASIKRRYHRPIDQCRFGYAGPSATLHRRRAAPQPAACSSDQSHNPTSHNTESGLRTPKVAEIHRKRCISTIPNHQRLNGPGASYPYCAQKSAFLLLDPTSMGPTDRRAAKHLTSSTRARLSGRSAGYGCGSSPPTLLCPPVAVAIQDSGMTATTSTSRSLADVDHRTRTTLLRHG
jgi:hypothetical protein